VKRLCVLSKMLIALCWLPVCSAMELPSELSGQGQATIRFDCKSTLHGFTGHVTCEPFTWHILTDPNTGSPVVRGEVEVMADKMDTKNKGRDKKMHAMFQSKKFPRIHAAVVDANLAAFMPVQRTVSSDKSPREIPGTLPVLLKIRNKQKKVVAQISHVHIDPNEITFTLDSELSLKSFGLKPPNVLGIIRVGDKIKIHADVTLNRKPSQTQMRQKEMTYQNNTALDPKTS